VTLDLPLRVTPEINDSASWSSPTPDVNERAISPTPANYSHKRGRAKMYRLARAGGHVLASAGAHPDAHVVPAAALNTDHPANHRLGLGRARKLRVLTEEQLSIFWENGFLVVEVRAASRTSRRSGPTAPPSSLPLLTFASANLTPAGPAQPRRGGSARRAHGHDRAW
jgi:hypothetical protein